MSSDVMNDKRQRVRKVKKHQQIDFIKKVDILLAIFDSYSFLSITKTVHIWIFEPHFVQLQSFDCVQFNCLMFT